MKHPRLFSKKQQQCIWARQNGRCGYCGCSMQDNQALYHHVLRYNDNGATNLENGVMLCEVCHVFVHHAGHYTTEIMLPRTEYKYANWQENKNYSLYLKN
jgi:5-methylcytosine-specific restriction endonuclease McrA